MKGAAPHPVRFTTSALKAAETDATKRALLRSANHLGLSFIAKTEIRSCKSANRQSRHCKRADSTRLRLYIPTIQRRSRGHRITTGGVTKAL